MVKRYEPHLKQVGLDDPTATMLEWVNGDWVEFGDYDALAAELQLEKAFTKVVQRQRDALERQCVTDKARIATLVAELAIYKGREEGKQIVIRQLEAELAFQKDLRSKYHKANCAESETETNNGLGSSGDARTRDNPAVLGDCKGGIESIPDPLTLETACELCEGSGESGVTHHDGTQYSTKTPPCPDCGGTGKRPKVEWDQNEDGPEYVG